MLQRGSFSSHDFNFIFINFRRGEKRMKIKNNKGQVAFVGVGAFIMLFVGLIVALNLIVPSAQNTNDVVNLGVVKNASVTFPNNGSTLVLTGQATSGWVIVNATDASKTVASTNYTVANYVVSNGVLTSVLTNVLAKESPYAGKAVNITYVYEPYGYATDSGTRAVTQLIIVMASLAIVGFVLYYAWKEFGEDLF